MTKIWKYLLPFLSFKWRFHRPSNKNLKREGKVHKHREMSTASGNSFLFKKNVTEMIAYLWDRLSWRSLNRLGAQQQCMAQKINPAVFVQKGLVSSAVDSVHILYTRDRRLDAASLIYRCVFMQLCFYRLPYFYYRTVLLCSLIITHSAASTLLQPPTYGSNLSKSHIYIIIL